MLHSLNDLEECEVGATDGNIGHVKDFYFDDDAWVVRYLLVDAGKWLNNRTVLISPMSMRDADWDGHVLPVSLSKEQIRNSPNIDTDRPVSRQNEVEYLGYYGYPNYWGGVGIWGGSDYPGMLTTGVGYGGLDDENRRNRKREEENRADGARLRSADPHLRSCEEVVGYHIHATNGEIGHVKSMLVDEKTWSIRYVVVQTSDWWFGHQVLVSPRWINAVDWASNSVTIELTRESIKSAPAFESAADLDRERETDLYQHHARGGYWSKPMIHDDGVAT